ncbi:MAG: aspartyl/glutamyl-tRNA(Asn/Gln) amidotransferase subunit [Candidatus Doudnabacteria bacterium]|nr:aspartyl/glutamyl-tRNA(Asn/Gln) amidotransferase subunit [Candidatus Doudnabacteria bacterium]
MEQDLTKFNPVIGLEIHVQLKTKSKMFCACANNPDESVPNTNICEVCTGQPGSLPVVNKEAVRLGTMFGLALNCKINKDAKFDRKSYFYPDLPKGYQISQYDKPIAERGYLDIEVDGEIRRIRITRAHLEEDAGKNIHPDGLNYSLVDYNRGGTPLLEIVTEPDITSAKEARIFLQELRNIVRYVGVGTADMEKGTMRCEPSISVRKPGQQELPPYKVEVKNINSFSFAESAIEYEIARQTKILEEGGTPKQVTMGWNEKAGVTVEQRSKEQANDYRYFPDPDIPVLNLSDEYIDLLKAQVPELPAQKRKRFKNEYALPEADINNLINWKELTEYYEQLVSEIQEWLKTDQAASKDLDLQKLMKLGANWCLQDFSALLNAAHIDPLESKVRPENLAELLKLIEAGKISNSAAKQVFAKMFETGGEPHNIVEDLGLAQVSDTAVIETVIEAVLSANEKAVTDYKAGQQKSFGFLVGMAMKELKGKGNPAVVNEILKQKLQK